MPARKGLPVPRMLRGTVVTHRRRCGKANCRCAGGDELHQSVVLSYSVRSRTKFVMLRPDEVAAVQAATERFRAAKASLEAAADEGLAELIERRKRQG